MPETIKVEKRKYASHIYWRVVFPILLVVALIALVAFVRLYPAMDDLRRGAVNAAANMRGPITAVLKNMRPQ